MDKFHDKMYKKLTDYNATLLRKCSKLYKQTAIVVEDSRVNKVKLAARNPDLPEFHEMFDRNY